MEKIFHELYLFLTTFHSEDKLLLQQFNIYLTSTLAFFYTDLLKRYFFRKFGALGKIMYFIYKIIFFFLNLTEIKK